MEQADATSGHVVIDIGDEPSCCAVCMEPLEWVAIGRCGHGDVCAHCTAIIRFFHRNRRCCICRTRCPTVLVTKAGKDRPQAFSMPRPPSGCEGRVDGNYWYLRNMRAYFDDRRQYKKMRKVCVKPQLPASIAEGVTVDLGVPSQQEDVDAELDAVDALAAECGCVGWFMIYLSTIVMMIPLFGLFYAASENYKQRVLVVLVFGLVSVGTTIYAILTWQTNQSRSTSTQIDAAT